MSDINIYDASGRKMGELQRGGDSLDGFGCVLSAILIIITIVGSVSSWPMCIGVLFSEDYSFEDKAQCVFMLISIVTVIAIHSRIAAKAENYNFVLTWLGMITSATLIPGALYAIVLSGYEAISGGDVFLCFLMCFFLACGAGLIGSVITAAIRDKH